MMKPVLLISDTHYHNFTAYAQQRPDGVNSRLADTLRATLEAAKALKAAGGDTIVHCGDAFHVRGAISPTVLNPVMDLYRKLIAAGFKIHMIAGNHDLETENAVEVAATVTALRSVGVNVISGDKEMVMIDGCEWHFVPWVKDIAALKTIIRDIKHPTASYLVLHAPLNDVIPGLPNHGLTPADFNGTPFVRVFCGHFHNHKSFEYEGGVVTSVGALTHQSWSDVGNEAGYCLYDPQVDALEHYETSAPQFIKVHFDDLDTIHDAAFADNYVKVVGGEFTDPDDINTIKEDLILRGAKAVSVEGFTRKPAATRGVTTTTGEAPSLETILSDYIDRTYPGDIDAKSLALGFLRETDHD